MAAVCSLGATTALALILGAGPAFANMTQAPLQLGTTPHTAAAGDDTRFLGVAGAATVKPYADGLSRSLADVLADTTNALSYCAGVVNTALDAGPCLQLTANTACAGRFGGNPSGHIFAPAGVYRIITPVAFVAGCKVEFEGVYSGQGDQTGGTWLSVAPGNFSPSHVPFYVNNVPNFEVRNIGLAEDQSLPANGATSWTPTDYGPMWLFSNTTTVDISHVNIQDANKAFDVGHGTKDTFRDIDGQCFTYCLLVEDDKDVMTASSMHGNIAWSANPLVVSYMQTHSVMLLSERNDGPDISDIFTIGAMAAVQLDVLASGSDAGPTTGARLRGIFADHSQQAILITGNGTQVQISQVRGQSNTLDGTSTIPGSRLITIAANNAEVQIAQTYGLLTAKASIGITGTGNTVDVAQAIAKQWGKDGTGECAIDSASGNTVAVEQAHYTPDPNGNTGQFCQH